MPTSARETTSHAKVGASAPMTPASVTTPNPTTSMRRGPNWPARRPMAGCPTALATYTAATRAAVCPAPTWKAAAIATSEVAMIEELRGLSDVPHNSAVTKGAGKGRRIPAVIPLPPSRQGGAQRRAEARAKLVCPASRARVRPTPLDVESSPLGPPPPTRGICSPPARPVTMCTETIDDSPHLTRGHLAPGRSRRVRRDGSRRVRRVRP